MVTSSVLDLGVLIMLGEEYIVLPNIHNFIVYLDLVLSVKISLKFFILILDIM